MADQSNPVVHNVTFLHKVLSQPGKNPPVYQYDQVVTQKPSANMSYVVTEIISTFSDNVTHGWNLSTTTPLPCVRPAYHEFPKDAFTAEQMRDGAVVLHVIFAVYMFVALAIVCDDYFVASLDRICEKLGFSEDVAGATFMAAGSSAPELFTAIIGVFITKGDVGVGTIVGSAVFNILFVIGICGVLVGERVSLSWWPLCRDSMYYAFAVIVLILVVADGSVTWYESVIMLVMYAGYIVVMRFNRSLQSIVTQKLNWLTTEKLNMNGAIGRGLSKFQGDYETFEDDDVFHEPEDNPKVEEPLHVVTVDEYAKSTQLKLTFPEAAFRIMMTYRFKQKTRFWAAARFVICVDRKQKVDTAFQRRMQFRKAVQKPSIRSYTRSVRNWFSMTTEGENFDFWRLPPNIDDGYVNFAKWLLVYPIRTLLYYTIPDCRKERWERWFLATFGLSIVWIAIFSYVMVWMVTIVGFASRIPDSVMGITFLAAGTSIPDAMASVFVVKQGMGDMAVSNCIGSNVFDILLGLSLPWFLKTAIVSPGSLAHINSHGILYSIILLFLTVLITIISVHISGWVLNRCVGTTLLSVYAIYLLFSVMIECNVFGFVNPPMCDK